MKSALAILGSLLKLKSLEGTRTYIAALGLLGLGLSQFASENYDGAAASILAALALIGLRDQKPTPTV